LHTVRFGSVEKVQFDITHRVINAINGVSMKQYMQVWIVSLGCEDSKHYLLHCPLYVNARENMVTSLSNINNLNTDGSALLFGLADHVENDNSIILQVVQMFIKDTKSFIVDKIYLCTV
jgi:hypothetical protein